MIKIRSIRPDEVPIAKRLIYRVAHGVFQDTRPLEEAIKFYESQGELHDMDNIQQNYIDSRGVFLIMTDDDQIIGTGAIRQLDQETCELKRLWLLFEYHGMGFGYRLLQKLLSIARGNGYSRVWLETDRKHQNRAFLFYKRMGFYEIPRYSDSEDDIAMELLLQ